MKFNKILPFAGLIAGLFLSIQAFAQPSDSEIISRAKSNGALTVKFIGDGDLHTTITETWYIRTFEAKYATELPDVKKITRLEYKYKKNGGSWLFDRFFVVESVYEGMPNPKLDDFLPLLQADMKKYYAGSYTDIVGEPSPIQLADEPKWVWNDMKSVEFNTVARYKRFVSYDEVQDQEVIHRVKLYSDEIKGPWLRFICSKGEFKILGTEKLTGAALEEANRNKFVILNAEKQAKARLASLPKVDIPDFASASELIYHTHEMVRTASDGELESYLLQTLSPEWFEPGTIVLTFHDEKKLKGIISARNEGKITYAEQYCAAPITKEKGSTSIKFYDKIKYQYSWIKAVEVDGKWKVKDVDYNLSGNDGDIAKMKAMTGNEGCGSAPAAGAASFSAANAKPGVKVWAKMSGDDLWYAGTITASTGNTAEVKFDRGKKMETVNFDNMTLYALAPGNFIEVEFGWNTGMFEYAEVISIDANGKVKAKIQSNGQTEVKTGEGIRVRKEDISNANATVEIEEAVNDTPATNSGTGNATTPQTTTTSTSGGDATSTTTKTKNKLKLNKPSTSKLKIPR